MPFFFSLVADFSKVSLINDTCVLADFCTLRNQRKSVEMKC